ncbi:glycosyltransferase family 2 protein [Thermococcus indicus]|uniref:Glycosyltransferase family 2 protein n=1 Tax=Thermococcus indicus TaxID=2586643 RepID=A0A4Y5SJV2_9EURY|nr:glycosyltransferase family A protein [Thermococcus indicus]QDA30482.1 glycosyltransferase family 2 protein [Thermococcus indicus]
MHVSVIISTLYKRPEEFKECLESIIEQTVRPTEVIIINGSFDGSWEAVNKEFKNIFKKMRDAGIAVKHIPLPGASLPHARNTGAKLGKGDILLFLDDDVVLERDYIKNLIKVYEEYPNAMGVQGFITNRINPNNPLIRFSFLKFLWWLLQRGYYEVNVHRQLPSLSEIIPYRVTRVITRESLSGTNMSYLSGVFKDLKFDERLKRYAIGEDKDFSYRVYKLFPASLYQTPHARLVHREAPTGRLSSKQFETMKQVYHLYLFYKLFDQNTKNKVIYILGRMGDLLLHSILLVTSGFKKERAIKVIYMIEAMWLALSNRNRIKKGEINFWWDEVS